MDVQDGTARNARFLIQTARKRWYDFSNIQSIAWSPDGNRIAAAFEDSKHRRREKSGILVVTLEPLGVQKVLAVDPLMPKPGGSIEEERPRYKLIGGWYFEGNAARRRLPKRFESIQWSSDGSRIAFLSDLDPSGYDFLFSMADDGSDMTRIDGSMDPAGPHNQPPPSCRSNWRSGPIH